MRDQTGIDMDRENGIDGSDVCDWMTPGDAIAEFELDPALAEGDIDEVWRAVGMKDAWNVEPRRSRHWAYEEGYDAGLAEVAAAQDQERAERMADWDEAAGSTRVTVAVTATFFIPLDGATLTLEVEEVL